MPGDKTKDKGKIERSNTLLSLLTGTMNLFKKLMYKIICKKTK